MMVKRARAKLADSTDFQQLAELLEISDQPRPENKLAFVGDKRLFYGPKNSTEHQAAPAYAQIGRAYCNGPAYWAEVVLDICH